MPASKTTMTAAYAIVEILKAEGVRHIFGLPGAHTLRLYDALRCCPGIRNVLVRHEQLGHFHFRAGARAGHA